MGPYARSYLSKIVLNDVSRSGRKSFAVSNMSRVLATKTPYYPLSRGATLQHHPSGARHGAQACLLALAGAALAHRCKLCAAAQPTCPRCCRCRRRPAGAAVHHHQRLCNAACSGKSLLASRTLPCPPLCTAAVLGAAGAAVPEVWLRRHVVPVLCGVVCELDTSSTLHHKL